MGTGLQAVAAAITDPDTISAFQTEDRDGSMSHRTFYGGMHELSSGLDDAAGGICELAKVLFYLLLPPCMSIVPVNDAFASCLMALMRDLVFGCRLYTMWEMHLRP